MTVDKKPLPQDLIDQLLANYKRPEDLIGEDGLLKQLTKALVERALRAEMAVHLGHDKHEPVENAAGNTRNGKCRKTLKGEFGEGETITVDADAGKKDFTFGKGRETIEAELVT